MSHTKIRVEPFLDEQALRVVLNAPKANVLDSVMMREINALLDDLQGRNALKLICFSGEGKHFSFGASVPEHVREKAADMLKAFHGMFVRLADLGIPTVAAVRGQCLGGGMELAAFCNWVFAHPEAKFAQPEIQLGVLPPVASLILPFKVGQSKADDINVTGRTLSAADAKDIGLVDEISDDPDALVTEWATRELATKSASSLRWAIKASRFSMYQTLHGQIRAMEQLYLDDLMATHDANEGLAAFMEKRQPSWKHN